MSTKPICQTANRLSPPKNTNRLSPPKNQLPGDSYCVQVYSHTDADGKRHYKSFTALSKRRAGSISYSAVDRARTMS